LTPESAVARMVAMNDPMTPPYTAPGPPAPGSSLGLAVEDARQRAIRLLSDGYAYDVLTEAEFEWRLGQLSLANSPAEVEALVTDLTRANHPHLPPATVPGSVVAPAEERIVGIMSESRRQGPWRVPQRLRILAVMSNMRIDLRYAIIPEGCTIEVRAIMANVGIIAPPGMMIDFDVSPVMGTTRNDASRVPASGYWAPHVRVKGSAVMSEVRVRVREPGR
jgi:hypothetical protein